ncbi:methyltransferase domain-containing protein [Paenibacillus sp. FSL W8-0426]|uniref:methyltransferase domain-containing protein n=1 Tax=Paenibacillus sp. FSL W8-0426 TaxID=2921714 RepID=UPI0030DD5B94
MAGFNWLAERATRPELMDEPAMGAGTELRQAHRHLRWLNHIFAASRPTLYGIQRLWVHAGKPETLSIADIGAGAGDINRRILRWADGNRIDMTIELIDLTMEACEEAKVLFADEPRIRVRQHDVFELDKGSADIVTCAQFLHHFHEEDVPRVVTRMLDISRIGLAINDIHRHWLAWAAVWMTTRLISRNRYIRHDGPLSVAKGFRGSDWERLRAVLPDGQAMQYAWRPLFRYAVILPKMSTAWGKGAGIQQ